MNPIQELRQDFLKLHPEGATRITEPFHGYGVWWLDLTLADNLIVVEWSEKRGFGVSVNPSSDHYGAGSDEYFETRPETLDRIQALIAEGL